MVGAKKLALVPTVCLLVALPSLAAAQSVRGQLTDSLTRASVPALWDEIHEALAAVAWTSRLPNYWYDLAHFQRELTASGRRKGADSTWRDAGYRLVPVKSAPPEELEAQGFVISAGEGAGW